jgi:hypothetical protein
MLAPAKAEPAPQLTLRSPLRTERARIAEAVIFPFCSHNLLWLRHPVAIGWLATARPGPGFLGGPLTTCAKAGNRRCKGMCHIQLDPGFWPFYRTPDQAGALSPASIIFEEQYDGSPL